MVVLGVLLLVAAGAVGLGGIYANTGSSHALTEGFTIFGYEFSGSTGGVFLLGIAVGAVAAFGLGLLVSGLGRGARKRATARRELKRARQEKEALQRQHDELAHTLDDERARADAQAERATPPERPAAEPHHTRG